MIKQAAILTAGRATRRLPLTDDQPPPMGPLPGQPVLASSHTPGSSGLAYLVSRYFGLRAYGVVYGAQLSAFGIGAGLGPPLTGLVFDQTHSYQAALIVGIPLFFAGAALIATLGRYPIFAPLSDRPGEPVAGSI